MALASAMSVTALFAERDRVGGTTRKPRNNSSDARRRSLLITGNVSTILS